MCTPTNKLKLCTCDNSDKLTNNYWVLLTKKAKKSYIIGDAVINYRSEDKTYKEVHLHLEKLLNSEFPFDKEIELKESDILKIKLSTKECTEGEFFAFKYCDEIWEKRILDPFTEYSYQKNLKGLLEWE